MRHDTLYQDSNARLAEPKRLWMLWVTVCFVLFVSGGATCIPRRNISDFQPTPVFDTPPTLEQIAEVLNRSRGIQSLQSNSVSVMLNNERSINANMTWARPKKFRMTASVAGIAGFDLGSNEEVFWMTVRNFATTPTMFFARHDEFESQVHRQVLPVSPVWLIEALGVNDLDLAQVYQTPVARPNGLIEIASAVPSPIGYYQRTLVVDPKFGFCREVFLKDPSGRLVASAYQSKHQYYPSVQTSLPHAVKVQLKPMGEEDMELDITISAYVVNGLSPEGMTQFTMPDRSSYQSVDLTRFNQGSSQAIAPPVVAPPQPTVPRNGYRGVPWDGPIIR